jgi:hypothetical protein
VTGGIGEDVIAAGKPLCAQLQHLSESIGLVVHHHVDMKLLWPFGISHRGA